MLALHRLLTKHGFCRMTSDKAAVWIRGLIVVRRYKREVTFTNCRQAPPRHRTFRLPQDESTIIDFVEKGEYNRGYKRANW